MTWKQTDPSSNAPWDGNRARWMTQLDDDIAIQDLSVPGTHDSAALEGFTHFNLSETQTWKIEEQLQNGIRFLDLRVKIMFQHKGLAMYHGDDALYDPARPHGFDQLYYKAVLQKCVDFLKQNPREVIILSVKCEGDTKYDGWTVEDWFRQIANEVAADNPPGTWDKWWDYRSNVNATLGSVRGKMLLWRRFPREGKDQTLDYSQPFGLDLTPMNDRYDNTKGSDWYTPQGGYSYVQDHYKSASVHEKFAVWSNTLGIAQESRQNPHHQHVNRQFFNFSSIGAGKHPGDYAKVMNPAVKKWLSATLTGKSPAGDLGATAVRSGFGVLPMDYPNREIVDLLIQANFGWTYRIFATQQGNRYWNEIWADIKNNEP